MPKLSNIAKAAAAVGAGVAGAVAAAWAATHAAELDPRFYPTRFGLARVFTSRTPDGRPIRVLAVGGGWQTVMYVDDPDTPAASYARAFDLVLDPAVAAAEAPRVLVIGGAGCAWPRHAVAVNENVQVEVAEIDPAVVEIARKEFRLDRAIERAGLWHDGTPRLSIEAVDGLKRLEEGMRLQQAPGEGPVPPLFDAVIDDAFVGRESADALTSPYGLALAKANLVPGGLFVVNVSVPKDDPSVLLAARDRVARLFKHVSVVPAVDTELAEEENYLVVGTDRDVDVSGAMVL